jgi:hypothetical protein
MPPARRQRALPGARQNLPISSQARQLLAISQTGTPAKRFSCPIVAKRPRSCIGTGDNAVNCHPQEHANVIIGQRIEPE